MPFGVRNNFSIIWLNMKESARIFFTLVPRTRFESCAAPRSAEHPLLGDRNLRRIIKANSLALNIDDPEWAVSDPRRINDTKCYLPAIGTAFRIHSPFFTPRFERHLKAKRPYIEFPGARLSCEFTHGIISLGLDPVAVELGRQMLRYKPAQGCYGCYGHIRGALTDHEVRRELRRELLRRGAYVVQPELDPLVVADHGDRKFTGVDKVFLAHLDGQPAFIGGFRTLLPADSDDARKGRNHGTGPTVWAEIVCSSRADASPRALAVPRLATGATTTWGNWWAVTDSNRGPAD